jgi:ABC-2 type transport system ATP-binding protein
VLIIHDGRLVADGAPNELALRSRGGDRIFLTIRGPQDEIQSRISRMPAVRSLKLVGSPGPGQMRFEIEAADGADPAEQLFMLAAENRWPLSELHRETSSLERVFIQLTQSEPIEAEPVAAG